MLRTKLKIYQTLTLTVVSVAICAMAPHVHAQSLKTAVQSALKTDPILNRNIANRFTMGEQLNQAKAGYFPHVRLESGIGREKTLNPTSQTVSGGRGWRALSRREGYAEVRQRLFDGGETTSEVRRTRAHVHSAAYQIVGSAQDVALEVSNAYLNVLLYQKRVVFAKNNVDKHEQILSMIKERSESGLAREADLEQAVGRVALARSNYIDEQGNLNDARSKFIRLVSVSPDNLTMPRVPGSKDLPKSLNSALKTAHDNHPILKSVTNDVEAARAQNRTARSALFPKADLVLYADRTRNLDGIVGPNNDQAVMFRGTYTPFQGGAIAAKIRETAYQIQEANEERNETIIELDEHVRLSLNALETTNRSVVYQKRHLDATASTVKAYNEQFKLNKRTLLDLLDAQAEYYQAELDLADAKTQQAYAKFRILNTEGCLLQFMGISVPVEATVPEPRVFQFL